jgi:hypothetical protein
MQNNNEPVKQKVISVVLRDAITNTFFFIVGTLAVILIGSWSRRLGIVLAAIETVFAAIQLLKVLFLVGGSVALFLSVRFGKRRREDDETEMRWASLIRIIELGIWMGCVFVLYRFFFR